MINLSSLKSHEQKDDGDDSRSHRGNDSYTFTKDQYD